MDETQNTLTATDLSMTGFSGQRRPKKSFSKKDAMAILQARAAHSYRGRDPVHLTLQRHWFVNVAYYLGITDFENNSAFLDVDPAFFPGNDGYRANVIQRYVRYMVSQLTSGEPSMSVTPKSPDPDDEFGAQVGEFFLAHYDDTLNFRRLRRDAAFWMVTTGNAFLRADWDAIAGREFKSYRNPYSDEEMSEEYLDDEMREMLQKMGREDRRREGMLEAEVISPFQVILPRGFRTIRDANYLIIEYERSLDWVWDHYPKEAKNINPDEKGYEDTLQYYQRLNSLVGRSGITIPSQGLAENETYRIYEMWQVPSNRFPNGLWVRGTRNTLLDHGPHPYHAAGINVHEMPWMRWPLTHLKLFQVPGRSWGMGLVEHLIGPQNDYNIGIRQSIQMRDRLALPQWIKPSSVEMDSVRNEYGDIWEYSGGMNGKPELIPAPSTSSMHIDARVRAIEDMQMISAQGEATQGQTPQGLRSGVALRALQEKEYSTIGPSIQEMEEGFEEFCTRVLTLTHKFMDVPKAIRTYGEMRSGDIAIFSGEQLFGNIQVRIRRGSMMPKSQAEAQSLMMEMLQTGAINPQDPNQMELFFKHMQIEGSQTLFSGRNADKRRARHENHMFIRPQLDDSGQMRPFPDVRDFDDHAAHLEEHMVAMKSDAFELMPPIRQMAFEAHIQKHQQALAQQQQAALLQQMQMAAMAGGGQGQGGSPPAQRGQPSQPRKRNPTPGTESE
jgi:hypothetical protein